jgi:hypothetical protein
VVVTHRVSLTEVSSFGHTGHVRTELEGGRAGNELHSLTRSTDEGTWYLSLAPARKQGLV